jgi:hypothetical protein
VPSQLASISAASRDGLMIRSRLKLVGVGRAGLHLVYGFLTTSPNAIVEPIHPRPCR